MNLAFKKTKQKQNKKEPTKPTFNIEWIYIVQFEENIAHFQLSKGEAPDRNVL